MTVLAHCRTILCGFSMTLNFASYYPPSYSAHICKLAGQDQGTAYKHGTALVPEIQQIHVTLGATLINS